MYNHAMPASEPLAAAGTSATTLGLSLDGTLVPNTIFSAGAAFDAEEVSPSTGSGLMFEGSL
jgi:hypothetical protein